MLPLLSLVAMLAPLQPQAVPQSPSASVPTFVVPGALWQAVATPATPSPDPQPPWVAFGEALETFLPPGPGEALPEAYEGDENPAAATFVVGLDMNPGPPQSVPSTAERGELVSTDAPVKLVPAQPPSSSLGPSTSSTPELVWQTEAQANRQPFALEAGRPVANPEQTFPPATATATASGDISNPAPIHGDHSTHVQAASVAATSGAATSVASTSVATSATAPNESTKTNTLPRTPTARPVTEIPSGPAETSEALPGIPALVTEDEPLTRSTPQGDPTQSTAEPQTLVRELLAHVEEHLDPTTPESPPKLGTEVPLDPASLIAGDPAGTAAAPAPSRSVEAVPLAAEPVPLEQLGGHLIRVKQEMTADAARLEVTLDPPELGRITIELAEVDERVSARLIVSESTTLEAVRQNLSSMMDALADAGVDVHDFQLESSLTENSSEEEEAADRVLVDVDSQAEQAPAEVSDRSGVNLLI